MKIVYANTVNFDHPLQQRPHHIFKLLAERGHEIFWVNQQKEQHRFRTKITENFIVYHDWDKFYKKFEGQMDVYFSSWSRRWRDIDLIKPKITVYDSLDLFPQNQPDEESMVSKSDIVLTTTKNLYDIQSKHTDNIHMCENGCFNSFRNNKYDIPEDIKNLPKPWILFSGALAISPNTGWCDVDLVEKLSKKYTVIVAGCIYGLNRKDQENIRKTKLSRVTFVGNKPYEELQKYYANCDINILPFKRCQVADYSHPLKLIEGCNMGKICVASDIPASKELSAKYPNAVLTSSGHNGFIENINKALKFKDNIEVINECHNLANQHDWNKKVDIIENQIYKFAEKNNIILNEKKGENNDINSRCSRYTIG